MSTFWKGAVYETMYVSSGGPCALRFEKDVEYIIYAYYTEFPGWLWTGLCDRSTQLPRAAYDLHVLGEGKAPAQGSNAPTPTPQATDTPTPDPPETGGGCGLSPHTTDLTFVGMLVGFAWLGLRKRGQ